MALGAAIEEVEAGAVPEPVNAAIEKFKEHGRPCEGVQSVALPFASTVRECPKGMVRLYERRPVSIWLCSRSLATPLRIFDSPIRGP